jgi:hypothetical protein
LQASQSFPLCEVCFSVMIDVDKLNERL